MQSEIELIKHSVADAQTVKWHEWEFVKGKLHGREIVAVQTGVGKVLAAIVTQHLIDAFEPAAVIMTGIGGSINPDFHRGDIVIGTDSIQHDMDSTLFGYKRGEIPYTPYRIIPSDPYLVEIAMAYKTEPLKKGRILTGDQFVSGSGRPEFDYLRSELEGDIVEMEGAAAGLAAMINEVPFLLIRAVSDNADGKDMGSYKDFIKSASKRSFGLIEHLLVNITAG